MRILATLAGAILAPCFLATAQETYWVANRASADLNEVSVCGEVVQTVNMPSSLRSAHVAPDGKIWVVRFIQSTVDILNPDGTPFTTITTALGSAFSIAFDNQGTAWISGGGGVENFGPNGTSIATFPLPASAPLGITIDAQGNKWIAHRTGPPGSVSRIDPAGNITNFPMPLNSGIQPVGITADFRGLMQPSHIWVTGDGGNELIELDAMGNVLNTYMLPDQNLTAPVFDLNGDIWVGDFRNGNLHQVDETTGNVLNTISSPPNIIGLAVDSFGRIWATSRVTFSPPGPPCEVRRFDPATGTLEIPALVGFGTQSALSTRFQYALVVAPFGDNDNDGVPNALELQGGISPFDPQSTGFASINTSGVTSAGSTSSVDLRVQAGASTFLAFGFGTVPVGSGATAPGITGEFLLAPAGIVGTLFVPGSTSIPVGIPIGTTPGTNLDLQGVTLGSTIQFTNVTCIEVW